MRAPITQCFTTPLLFEFGSGFAYGAGLDLVGLMVARANNCTLKAYMLRHILDVLGMDRNSISGEVVDDATAQPLDPQDEYGGAGLFSTAEDYLRLLKSLLRNDGKLLEMNGIDLNQTFSVPLYAAIMIPGDAPMGTPGARKCTHTLGGLAAMEDDADGGLKAGTLRWGGAPHLKWWIDRAGGTCGMFAKEVVAMYA
ncbi:hypothetical protein G6011_07127 [Alternaria panax]|uniref:Beta-lactamase-related domain-containing protein n=1 Tax=Alternaria panax TaxID=48097 RepID=A0AAD4FA24_9PLEO|nr:hypothetical protein G6011_07127 [Alternaria panax]